MTHKNAIWFGHTEAREMTTIRDFVDYRDASRAVAEAGFRFVTDSNRDPLTGQRRESGRSFAPTVRYRHPATGEEVEVLWANDRGAIRRLTAREEVAA